VLNTRIEAKNTVFDLYVACFVNTVILNMDVNMAIYRVQQAEYVIRIRMAASQEYVNTYSTRRDRSISRPLIRRNGPLGSTRDFDGGDKGALQLLINRYG